MNDLGKSIYGKPHSADNQYCRATGIKAAMNGDFLLLVSYLQNIQHSAVLLVIYKVLLFLLLNQKKNI
jgi:hypothetical protein